MLAKVKMSLYFAAAVLLAACGGGGGDGGGGAPADAGTPPAGSPPPAGNDGGDSVVDQRLQGQLEMVANQLVYIRTNRTIYLPVGLDRFEAAAGIFDIAAGSKGGEEGTALPPPALAPAAPIAAFGIRLNRFVQPSSAGQSVGGQTVVGRVAVELTERADSPGGSGMGEIMRFVMDRVELATNANGELTSARVRDGAQMHVYGRNAAGTEVRETIPVPIGAVRLLPISEVPDNFGDTSSVVLLFDFETAFSQAGNRLAALEDIAGHFAMHITLSSAEMVRPAAPATSESPALERRDLIGQAITVNSQTPVNGAGISGNAWIRMYPPVE